MMNVLVTGCAGFIGSHLCEKLLSQNLKVIGVDNFDDFYPRSIKEKNLSLFSNNPNFVFKEVDLTVRGSLSDINDVDVVIHLAAKAGVRPSVSDPLNYLHSNIVGTQNLLDFLVEKKIRKYKFGSSSSIYGNTSVVPFTESDPCNSPISPYAYTKKVGEMMAYTYHQLYDIDTINLRFFTVFGPRQRPDLAIFKFVKLIKEGKSIQMFGDGETARDYTFVSDIVDGIYCALNYLMRNEKVFDQFNIGNNYPVTLKKLIQTIYSELNVKPNIVQKEWQKGEVEITFADISKANKILGYQPQIKFEDGISMFIKWYDEKNI